MKTRHGFAYNFFFGVLDGAEAFVSLLCLGRYTPGWSAQVATWWALHRLDSKRKGCILNISRYFKKEN